MKLLGTSVLPEPERRRPLAIGLLVMVVLVVYGLTLHPFILKHMSYNEEIEQQVRALKQFRALAAQRELYEQALREVSDYQAGNTYYMRETARNLASAEMQRMINRAVENLGEEPGCQVISLQNVQPRVEEVFPRVTVKVRMRCRTDALRDLLYELEGSTPLLFVDNVNVYRQRARRRRGRVITPSHLDVRFDVSAYLRSAG